MSKKLTSNTFDGGLVKDYHPLTTLNNILTDALNATFVTMNGNEAILQNDMGNARVESAFLPNGYVPVGIKEYGGIIYVASYNPITNKSQLGCFPSPERNIDLEETDDPQTPLTLVKENGYTRIYKFKEFNNENFDYQKGLGLLTNKILIFGDGKIIRSGDKFGLYFKGENNTDILSNYDFNKKYKGQNNNLVDNPDSDGGYDTNNNNYKNNLVTLSVQVLDSNNNLRDLTSQLKRINPENKERINFDTDELANLSEDDKFNSGYFMYDLPNESGDDVTSERSKQALNTYNNKLFGSLYLVGNLNTVLYIDTSVQVMTSPPECEELSSSEIWEKSQDDCSEVDNNKKALMFYIDLYYNFPDLYVDCPYIVCNFDGSFYVLNEYPESGYGLDPTEGNVGYRTVEENLLIIKEKPIYDKLTNLYKQRFVGFLDVSSFIDNINDPNSTVLNPIINYIVIPRLKLPDDNTYKLTHIATEGSIDLSKIGSGLKNVNIWRYTCDGTTRVNLNWGLEDYPLESDILGPLQMDFYDGNKSSLNNTLELTTSVFTLEFNKTNYNGSFLDTIYLSDESLKPRHIYLVRIHRTENDIDTTLGWKILITTPIYNSLWSKHDDYCSSDALSDIQELNEITLSFEIKEKSNNNTSIQFLSDKLLKKVNDGYEFVNESICYILFDLANIGSEYIYAKFSTFTITNEIEISLKIPDIYPFDIDNPNNILYELSSSTNINDDLYANIIGGREIPELDDLDSYLYNDNFLKNKSEIVYPQIDLITNKYSGNNTFKIKTEYNIPSIISYLYDSSPSTINIQYTYKNLIEHITNQLTGQPIIVPATFVNNDNGNRYFHLFYYNIDSNELNRTISDENSDEDEDIFNDSSGGDTSYKLKLLSNYKKQVNESLQIAGVLNSTFVFVGSPTMFGWDIANIDNNLRLSGNHSYYHTIARYLAEVLNNEFNGGNSKHAANFLLRRKNIKGNWDETLYEGITANADMAYMKYNNWYMLLWKNTKGEFTIVDKAIVSKLQSPSATNSLGIYTTSIKNYVLGILDLYKNTYFKLEDPTQISGYKISNNVTYNDNYSVNIQNTVTLLNIEFNNSNILKFVDDGGIITNNILNSNDLSIELNYTFNNNVIDSLGEFLNFKLLSNSSETVNINPKTFKIQGLSSLADSMLNNLYYGVIKHDDQYYLKDINNSDLIEDIYFKELDSNGFINSTLVNNNSIRSFLTSLKVDNNDIFVNRYLSGTSLLYGHGAGRAPSGGSSKKLGVVIGDFPCFKNIDYSNNINYNEWQCKYYTNNTWTSPTTSSSIIFDKIKLTT